MHSELPHRNLFKQSSQFRKVTTQSMYFHALRGQSLSLTLSARFLPYQEKKKLNRTMSPWVRCFQTYSVRWSHKKRQVRFRKTDNKTSQHFLYLGLREPATEMLTGQGVAQPGIRECTGNEYLRSSGSLEDHSRVWEQKGIRGSGQLGKGIIGTRTHPRCSHLLSSCCGDIEKTGEYELGYLLYA